MLRSVPAVIPQRNKTRSKTAGATLLKAFFHAQFQGLKFVSGDTISKAENVSVKHFQGLKIVAMKHFQG